MNKVNFSLMILLTLSLLNFAQAQSIETVEMICEMTKLPIQDLIDKHQLGVNKVEQLKVPERYEKETGSKLSGVRQVIDTVYSQLDGVNDDSEKERIINAMHAQFYKDCLLRYL